MVDYYRSVQGQIRRFSEDYCEYNNKINCLLDYMYKYVEEKIKDCVVVEYKGKYYADENHKWGLMPMHYEKQYYKVIYHKLCDLLRSRK